jgi:hypothetical protein
MKLDATTKTWLGSASTAAGAISICAPLRGRGVIGERTLLFVFLVPLPFCSYSPD